MEVADQWRREWAGTAEYGKVVEGGVTRRIARAMEVLHASAPGARMKVMRAAYHTTAGPGVPASSYMVHATRRVYSSGFNSGFLEPPSLPTEPLEISSTPLALLQDPHSENENYKVTEPDDLEISEPSKWRSSTGGSIRMPSEESSSTDNASIIDVSRNHKSAFRKYSCDSENSDIHSGRSSRLSPLLDEPALSTLKFKSFLNGNNDWHNRRKSYSFEDTSPLSETILHSNDTLAMESSTDSGICKSTELVNDYADENLPIRYFGSKERSDHTRDNTFENWLSKNKQHNHYKGTKFKTYRDYEHIHEDPKENNITLQPTGKLTITLPVTLETEQEYETRKNYEEHQRKIKKVEFCKTELHFAAETGKVNIIATDEKPPPSNDFRKRRSAFVPMRDITEKPITLFGEKTNDFSNESNSTSYTISEFNESDENTAATKSILKNKIPKPKPYLLGENMAFGTDDEPNIDDGEESSYVPTAVSLINKQLQAERQTNEISGSFSRQQTVSTKMNAFRTTNQGPGENLPLMRKQYEIENGITQKVVRIHEDRKKFSAAKKSSAIARSPTPARLKARELRDSDLTYFGVDNAQKETVSPNQVLNKARDNTQDELHDLFQSVKLIQQVSNSVCNSESEDAPEYQNLPINSNFVPKPSPRIRTKFGEKPNHIDEIVLKPIVEQETSTRDNTYRRSKAKTQEELSPIKNRSRSEPRKSYKISSTERNQQHLDQSRNSRDHSSNAYPVKAPTCKVIAVSDDDNPIYVNLKMEQNNDTIPNIGVKTRNNVTQKVPKSHDFTNGKTHRKLEAMKSNSSLNTDGKISPKRRQINEGRNTASLEKKNTVLQSSSRNTKKQPDKVEKSQYSKQKTPSKEHAFDTNRSLESNNLYKQIKQKTHSKEHAFDTNRSLESNNSYKQINSNSGKKEHRSRSSHRHSKAVLPEEATMDAVTTLQSTKDTADKPAGHDVKAKRHSSRNNSSSNDITIIPKVGTNSSKTSYSKDSARHSSRPSRREYVINYDDQNGTVSSVCKIRSGSASPRRKKTTREGVKEKFKENLKYKSSDKAALLQIEDHQWDSNTVNGYRKRKADNIRSCQVL